MMNSMDAFLFARKFENKEVQEPLFPRDYVGHSNDSFYSNGDSGASTSSPTSSITSSSDNRDEEPIDLSCHNRDKVPVVSPSIFFPNSFLHWPYLLPPAALGSIANFHPLPGSLFNPGLYSQHHSNVAPKPIKRNQQPDVINRYQTVSKNQNDDIIKTQSRDTADVASASLTRSKNVSKLSLFHNLPTMVTSQYASAIGGVKRKREIEEETAPPTDKKSKQAKVQQNSIEKNEPTAEGLVRPQPVNFKPCRLPCDVCGRTYATIGALAKHAKTHEDPEAGSKFNCKICKKECTSLGSLRMHIRTHTLPCECHICGKAFSRTWLLQGHIRTHTGEKPYECSVCSRAFADRSNLRAHMQTHETIKRYSCTTCDKTFSRISLLKRHQSHCDVNKSRCDA